MAGKVKDLVGKKIGPWEVVSRSENKARDALWNCLCDCGKTVEMSTKKLKLQLNKSCTCNKITYDHVEEKRTGLKTCRFCSIEKTLSDYPINQKKPNGVSHECKACQSLKTKLKYFGITQVQYNDLRENASDCCEICGISEQAALENNQQTKHYGLYIDHDHTTGIVRGLLCHNCNLLVGHAKDNVRNLLAAINYLEKKSEESNV